MHARMTRSDTGISQATSLARSRENFDGVAPTSKDVKPASCSRSCSCMPLISACWAEADAAKARASATNTSESLDIVAVRSDDVAQICASMCRDDEALECFEAPRVLNKMCHLGRAA